MNGALHARTEALLRRLVRREADPALRKVIARVRSEDLAAAMAHLTWAEQRRLYRAIDDLDRAAEMLTLLPEEAIRRLTEEMTEEAVADLVDRLEVDDAADVVAALPEGLRARVLAELDPEEQAELKAVLTYPADSAGGIMSTDCFVVPHTATCASAQGILQSLSDDLAYVHYAHVVDAEERLLGITSLRLLVIHPPHTPVSAFMVRDPISVRPTDDQEEVARIVERYDLMSVPVVDEHGHLLGIVTVDDVVDVLREEAEEDLLRMAGLSEGEELAAAGLMSQVRQRGGWLMATIIGGLVGSEIIGGYQSTLAQVALLAGFIPIVMGMGGNVGVQSATLAVRGLATGHVQLGGAWSFLGREVRVGLALGIAYGAIVGVYGVLRFPESPRVALSVGSSIAVAMTAASFVGAGVPLLLSKRGTDPAVATGPLVTTFMDLMGISVYFTIATLLLGLG